MICTGCATGPNFRFLIKPCPRPGSCLLQPTTLASLNDALNVIGIRITAPGGSVQAGDWSITDGRALMRYFDGVVGA